MDEQLERHFTVFERAVLVAWLDRTCRDLPTWNPMKALRILKRWPWAIERLRRFLLEGRLL